MNRIYLDHAATTPLRPEALEAMMPFFSHHAYNPSSVHAEGRAARSALDAARESVASVLNAKPKEIVFTASGSEADSLAIAGAARANRGKRRMVSIASEHRAVLQTLETLRDDGCEVSFARIDADGVLDPADFAACLTSETLLATVAYANNEIGTVQPIETLASIAHECGALFHTDAVQAAAFLPIDVRALGADLLSLAAHKFGGPKGVGVLYAREGVAIAPAVHGGSQESGRRAGTENLAGIAGMAAALQSADAERAHLAARLGLLRDRFEARVTSAVPGTRVNGAGGPRIPNISNLSFLDVQSEALIMRLDLDGLAVSAGSACAAGAVEPSHVIRALGLPSQWTRGVIRVSFGRDSSQADADRAAELVVQAVEGIRAFRGAFSNEA